MAIVEFSLKTQIRTQYIEYATTQIENNA